ncbi:MAG TPA: LLM class flavin-dependent oxidoreductase [Candidatus Limnocylindria bacterium]|jgi:alkanesulfonate monooxygenase SsuD/methylene tetrahydromethanopterin reductase-like flavin-dependent oxidoreductase (luciferase family)|nr:LLM class flavin-dependent oxidoreductase [Candidatus Limnocylindria bacterium]
MNDNAVKLGALCWNQYTDWPAYLEAGVRADRLGFDSLWAWDHLYPIVGSHEGPIFEGYLTLAAWAQATQKVSVGLMVGANPFRNPALVAKMVTTLDHISGGRAYLGIGSAWFETEHRAFGLDFGDSPGERLRWLAEALPVIRGMLHGEAPSAAGRYYQMQSVRNDPPPVQDRLPLLVGGGGEKVTLRLVARYADANNVGGGFESVQRKEAILRRHCEEVGRDHTDIERTAGMGAIVIRDSEAEARRVFDDLFERNGGARPWRPEVIGTPEQAVERMARYVELGYRHLICGFPAPYDEESMTRLATEIKPKLASPAGTPAAV